MIPHLLAVALGVAVIYCGRCRKDFRQSGEQYGWYALGIVSVSYATMSIIEGLFDLGETAGVVNHIGTVMVGMGIGMLATLILIAYGRKQAAQNKKDAEQEAGEYRR